MAVKDLDTKTLNYIRNFIKDNPATNEEEFKQVLFNLGITEWGSFPALANLITNIAKNEKPRIIDLRYSGTTPTWSNFPLRIEWDSNNKRINLTSESSAYLQSLRLNNRDIQVGVIVKKPSKFKKSQDHLLQQGSTGIYQDVYQDVLPSMTEAHYGIAVHGFTTSWKHCAFYNRGNVVHANFALQYDFSNNKYYITDSDTFVRLILPKYGYPGVHIGIRLKYQTYSNISNPIFKNGNDINTLTYEKTSWYIG